MKIYDPGKLILITAAIVIPIAFIGLIIFFDYNNARLTLDEEVYGIIQKKGLSVKGFPKITIFDSTFYFTFYNTEVYNLKVLVGDSISKQKGKYDACIYRKDSNNEYAIICTLKYHGIKRLDEY